VYCGQTVERIKMKLGMQIGLGYGHILLDGDPVSPPQFLAHIRCGQMAAGMKMPLGVDVARTRPRRLRVKWRFRSPPQKGIGALKFSAHVYCDQTAAWIKIVVGKEV